MPTYAYRCKKCESVFEKFLSIASRKEPEQNPCPECNENDCVEQTLTAPPALVSDSIGIHRRAGNEFNDRMKQIKKGSGMKNTIKTI